MFHSDLNFYSLSIPIMMMVLGASTLLLYKFKTFAQYLAIYAIALMCMGLSVFLHTIFVPKMVLQLMPLIFGLYYLACALHTDAIYQRLQIKANHQLLTGLVFFGILAIAYASWWSNHQSIRLLITACMTIMIYLHQPVAFLQQKPAHNIDRFLKNLTYLILVVALIRAVMLSLWMDQAQLISTYALIWATTQLFLLIIDVLFLVLFLAAAILELLQKLHRERCTDPLTGLLNRRGFHELLTQLPARHWRCAHAILLADLDHFKKINDHYGHHAGDLALQHISQILKYSVQQPDDVVRMGGEEFLILLPNSSPEQALALAEHIRSNIEQTPLHLDAQRIPLSISIGLSFFREIEEFEHGFGRADHYLYQAKAMGRNQVRSAWHS